VKEMRKEQGKYHAALQVLFALTLKEIILNRSQCLAMKMR